MTNEQMKEKYVSRLNKCLSAIKILVICAMAAVAALIIFIVAAKGVELQDSNPEALMIGVIIPGSIAAACVIGALSALGTAAVTLKKLNKQDSLTSSANEAENK